MAQVSVNITDMEETGIQQVYDEVVKDSQVCYTIGRMALNIDLKYRTCSC